VTYKMTGLRTWNSNATDLEASVAFYRDILGAEETTRHQARGGFVVRLKIGGNSVGLFDAQDGPRPGIPHHTFTFDGPADPQDMIKEIEDKGGKVEDFRMHGDGPGYSVYVHDPNGNILELSTDPA